MAARIKYFLPTSVLVFFLSSFFCFANGESIQSIFDTVIDESTERKQRIANLQAILADKDTFIKNVSSGAVIKVDYYHNRSTEKFLMSDLSNQEQNFFFSFLYKILPANRLQSNDLPVGEILELMNALTGYTLKVPSLEGGKFNQEEYLNRIKRAQRIVYGQFKSGESRITQELMTSALTDFLQQYVDALTTYKAIYDQNTEIRNTEAVVRAAETAVAEAKSNECLQSSDYKRYILTNRILNLRKILAAGQKSIDRDRAIEQQSGVADLSVRHAAGEQVVDAQRDLDRAYKEYESLEGSNQRYNPAVIVKNPCPVKE